MKKIMLMLSFVLCLFLVGNAFALSFNDIAIWSDNRADGNWYLYTEVYLNGESTPGSSSVGYSANSTGPFTMNWTSFGSYSYYSANVLNTTGWSSPLNANGKVFTWTANGLTASGTVPDVAVKQIALSYDQKVLDPSPSVNRIEWYNSDPNVEEYRVRLFDGSNNYLDNENIISSSDSHIIHDYTGFTFIPGVDYKFRIEAREYGDLEGDGRYWNRSRVWLDYKPVPEPATMLLFGAGLVGLAGFGRKKFKK